MSEVQVENCIFNQKIRMKKIVVLTFVGIIAVSCGEISEDQIQAEINKAEEKSQEVIAEVKEEEQPFAEGSYIRCNINGEDVNIESFSKNNSIVSVYDDIASASGRSADEKRQVSFGFSGPEALNPVGVIFPALFGPSDVANKASVSVAYEEGLYNLVEGEVTVTKLDVEGEIMEGNFKGKMATPQNIQTPENYVDAEGSFSLNGVYFTDARTKK